jgi:ParB family transcriptional regulator, chromosome partitioning protein
MVRKSIELGGLYAKSQLLTQQQKQIEDLMAEVEKLRAIKSPNLEAELATLRNILSENSGAVSISIREIRPNPWQPRKTINEESIAEIAESLRIEGQTTPIIVSVHEDGYLLWDGERRWRGATKNGWSHIQAVLAPLPGDLGSLHRKALISFLHHEDLNPLDKAEAIVREILRVTALSEVEIPGIIRVLARRVERLRQKETEQQKSEITLLKEKGTIHLRPEQEQVMEVLKELQLKVGSLAAFDMRMLSLPIDLKQAIREGLGGAHALSLSNLTEERLDINSDEALEIRKVATLKVLNEKMSLGRTRELVKEIIDDHVNTGSINSKVIRLQKAINVFDIESLKASDLVELQSTLQEKLKAIKCLLKNS